MRLQREQLCEDIRQDILQDDITKKLVQYKDEDMSDIFAIELRKHDAKKKLLEQNMYAQANILEALTESNAMYADTRRVISDLLSARRELISSLVTSFYAFDDLLVKAAKGLEFYAKLDSNVSKLLNRVKVKKNRFRNLKRIKFKKKNLISGRGGCATRRERCHIGQAFQNDVRSTRTGAPVYALCSPKNLDKCTLFPGWFRRS